MLHLQIEEREKREREAAAALAAGSAAGAVVAEEGQEGRATQGPRHSLERHQVAGRGRRQG